MNQIRLYTILFLAIFISCSRQKVNVSSGANAKFNEFRERDKFGDESILYPGLSNPSLRSLVNQKINLAANDFEALANAEGATAKDYQEKIKTGLQRFEDIYNELDTEDREQVCHYFEELMDIVGLESSGGHLNKFMYGFDPS